MNDRYTSLPEQPVAPYEPGPDTPAVPAPGRTETESAAYMLGDPSLYLVAGQTLHRLDVDPGDVFAAMDERTARIALAFLEMATDRALRRVRDLQADRGGTPPPSGLFGAPPGLFGPAFPTHPVTEQGPNR